MQAYTPIYLHLHIDAFLRDQQHLQIDASVAGDDSALKTQRADPSIGQLPKPLPRPPYAADLLDRIAQHRLQPRNPRFETQLNGIPGIWVRCRTNKRHRRLHRNYQRQSSPGPGLEKGDSGERVRCGGFPGQSIAPRVGGGKAGSLSPPARSLFHRGGF